MGHTPCIHVIIVDDQDIVRDSMEALLSAYDEIKVIASFNTGAYAFDFLKDHSSDVDTVIMDIKMPGDSGIVMTKKIRETYPDISVLILTGYDQFSELAMRTGAHGFVVKQSTTRELIDAIKHVSRGTKFFQEPNHSVALSAQDIKIVSLISQGCSNVEIARELNLSSNTVGQYLSTIFKKLHANDRAHAVAIALRRGLID